METAVRVSSPPLGNDDRFLDLDVVDGAADKSGEGEIQEFASEFQ